MEHNTNILSATIRVRQVKSGIGETFQGRKRDLERLNALVDFELFRADLD
jgi:hypothetical protein